MSVAPVNVAGLNATVIPAGAPVLVRATSAVKLVRVSVTVEVPLAPAWIDTVAGATASEMLPAAAVTVTVSVVVAFDTPVPAPVNVIGYLPAATAAPTVTVTVEVNVAPVSVAGLKATVMPAGAPLLVRVTSPVKLLRVRVRVAVPFAPAAIDTVAGATASVMLDVGGAVTVTVNVDVALVTPVPAPVIVIA